MNDDDRKAGLVIYFNGEMSHKGKASVLRQLASELAKNEMMLAGPLFIPGTDEVIGYYQYQFLDEAPLTALES